MDKIVIAEPVSKISQLEKKIDELIKINENFRANANT